MVEPLHGVAKVPCKSCPYRKDVPSGVWAATEYVKLPPYDGTIVEQLLGAGRPLFMCHQQDGNLCAGWLGTHGPKNLLALRLHVDSVKPEVFDYESPVPLFASGAEACEHGLKGVKQPDAEAKRVIDRLFAKRKRDALRGPRKKPIVKSKRKRKS